MIHPLRILKAIIEYPIGERSNPARELAPIGHEKRRAHIRSVARQLCRETNQPIPPALRG